MSGLTAHSMKMLPPGLEPPPGLPLPPGLEAPVAPKKKSHNKVMRSPPGLPIAAAPSGRSAAARAGAASNASAALDAEPMYVGAPTGAKSVAAEPAPTWAARVLISGLPNKILPMMEVVLEQAGLEDAVLDVTTCPGKPCGDATVSLCSTLAAEQCVRHFQGCQWDPAGATVSVRLLSSPAPAAKEAKGRLSAKAPAFEPRLQVSALTSIEEEAVPSLIEKEKLQPCPGSSDASTEVGESSEPEDEAAAVAV